MARKTVFKLGKLVKLERVKTRGYKWLSLTTSKKKKGVRHYRTRRVGRLK